MFVLPDILNDKTLQIGNAREGHGDSWHVVNGFIFAVGSLYKKTVCNNFYVLWP